MRQDYADWLKASGYDIGTVTSQLHRCGRVEGFYGDLDTLFVQDRLSSLMEQLRYSTEDERRKRPNPTRLPIRGVLRTNLASYRNAVSLYKKFKDQASPPHAEGTAVALSRQQPIVRAKIARAGSLVPPEHARTMAEFGFDGRAALAAIITTSRYKTLAQAVASLSVFSHPDTVKQTRGEALFPTIRGTPGMFSLVDGRELMLDDNRSPTAAFCWSNQLGGRSRDIQFNHVYAISGDVHAYTALPNICMTPAFLAKATDTDAEVRSLLEFRSFDLYAWVPRERDPPARPVGYSALEWAAPLPVVTELGDVLEAAMRRKPKDRTVVAARRLGWLFGDAEDEQARS